MRSGSSADSAFRCNCEMFLERPVTRASDARATMTSRRVTRRAAEGSAHVTFIMTIGGPPNPPNSLRDDSIDVLLGLENRTDLRFTALSSV
jgi:hypothetical protein